MRQVRSPGSVTPYSAFRSFLAGLMARPIPPAEWRECERCLFVERFESRQLIQAAGVPCNRVLFLTSGLARTFVSDAHGRDFTWSLHFGGDAANLKNRFLLDYASLVSGEPSPLWIEALSAVEVVALRKADMERLYAESRFWNGVGRQIAESAYYYTQQRTLDLLCLTAKARYARLVQESPALVAAAPQHYLASYLGVTPQSLSRIRRELRSRPITKCE